MSASLEAMADDYSPAVAGVSSHRAAGKLKVLSDYRVHAALMFVQFGYGGYYVLSKAALTSGVNQFVFSIYRDGVALILLCPFAFFAERELRSFDLSFSTITLIALGGLTGVFGQQILFLKGLSLTSTAFAASIQSSIPIFAFAISVLFRLEQIHYTRRDGQAKILGLICCISAAILMPLYKGPVIFGHRSRKNSQPHQIDVLNSNLNVPTSANAITRLGIGDWQLGSICLFTDCLCNGIYLNLQTPLLRRYPAPVSITAYAYLFGSLLLTITGLFSVSSRSDWYINQPGDILAFVYAGAIPSAMNFAVQTWCTQKRGPVLVTAYIPVQTVVSALLAYFFLGDSIHFGSLLGGILIVMGLYLVVWGQDKDRHLASRSIKAKLTADGLPVIEPMGTLKTPLLGYQTVQ